MEYHKDRFEDFSLMIYKRNKLFALLPANKVDNELHSHQGLSYGGLILKNTGIKFLDYTKIFSEILKFLDNRGITVLKLKPIPIIYNDASQEIDLILFWLNAKKYRSDIYSYIDKEDYSINRNRKRAINQAKQNNIQIKESDDYSFFWNNILSPNLDKRFDTSPVHTIEEIVYLKSIFKEQIKLFCAFKNNKIVAGALIFIFENIIHFQYSSGSNNRKDGALDLLFFEITNQFKNKEIVSFGSSSIPNGTTVSKGLLYWKESLGAKNIVQNFFEIQTKNFKLLNDKIV